MTEQRWDGLREFMTPEQSNAFDNWLDSTGDDDGETNRALAESFVPKPKRIQQRRTKGWRMPLNAKGVARPSRWGNPFKVGEQMFLTGKRAGEKTTAADVVGMYRHYATLDTPGGRELREKIRKELAGFDLACYCPIGSPCHADVLLELANQ